MMSYTLDSDELSGVSGGQMMGRPQGGQDDGPAPPRTWKGTAKTYARACVQGAGENLMMMGMFGGLSGPAGVAGAAGLGCAMGVGMQGLNDGINKVFGPDE